MNENIFEDVERDVASDEECDAILEDIKRGTRASNYYHKVEA